MVLDTIDYIKMMRNMITLQQQVNEAVSGKKWPDKHFAWELAAIEEAVELLQSTNWYWWKKSTTKDIDWKNIEVELVDLMAFTLSKEIEDHVEDMTGIPEALGARSEAAVLMFNHNKKPKKKVDDLTVATKKFIANAAADSLNIQNLLAMIAITMDYTRFYKLFIGKAMLNIFRQEKGYKKGTYKKYWIDREDNVAMQEIVESLPLEELIENPIVIYEKLEEEYKKVLKA